ncbi:MAG TPA: hypothetical protein VFC19_03815 [Candidatus Limnocylindrales bacterium]|nr:hypothetical protein [Candidatus Limnocylindrales bacterium]
MIVIVTHLIVLALLWIAAPKPSPTPSPSRSPWSSPPDVNGWLWRHLSSAWQWVTAHAALLAGLAIGTAATAAAWYVLRRLWWRYAVDAGTWVEVVPPRQVSVGQSAAAWRLLASLAVRTRGGLHLVKPPLAMEIHGQSGRLALTVWVPGWVTASAVAGEVRLAWPGATTRPFRPPVGGDGWKAAGYRLVPTHTDLGPLVDDTHMGRDAARDADPLRPVFDALRRAGGPTVLQLLARPAPGRRIDALASAARRPAPPRRTIAAKAADLAVKGLLGLIRLGLDILSRSSRSPAAGRGDPSGVYRPPDALQRAQMRRAADKLVAGPHLLVAIRTLAMRPGRAYARSEARAVAHGYAVSAKLRPRRLWHARSAVTGRYAHRGQWLLATASELGVLFHFPADPARHGFTVAALTRSFPTNAAQIPPERPTPHTSGWNRSRWSTPAGLAILHPDNDAADQDADDEDADDGNPGQYEYDEYDDGESRYPTTHGDEDHDAN